MKQIFLLIFLLAVCGYTSEERELDRDSTNAERNFSSGERWKTWALNFYPGLGSIAISVKIFKKNAYC
jgi:hypothetical protein